MRNHTKTMRNLAWEKIIVENNKGGFKDVGMNKKANKNCYTDVMNMVLSEEGNLQRRKTAFRLGTNPDSSYLRVSGMMYHQSLGYIRVRGDKIETLSDPAGTWVEIANGYNVTGKDHVTFVNFFASSITATGNVSLTEDSELRSLTAAGMTPNEHIGKLLKIGNEIKLIESNTATVIYISETIEGNYPTGTVATIHDQVPAVYIYSKNNNVRVWRGGANLETLSFSFDKAVLQSYGGKGNNGRMFGIRNDDKVYITEVGTGEYVPTDNFLPLGLQGDLVGISILNNRAVIYSNYGRVSLRGDNPSNFRIEDASGHKGCIASGSISNGNNIEFYLSHEGVEFLNAIETATVTEGISMSDAIKKRFQRHDDFSGAMAAMSNGKYYLNIEGLVYIYDLEKSVANHKPIFTLAEYTEASQALVPEANVGEWTFAEDIDGKLFFGQGGFIYQITDEKIGKNVQQLPIKYGFTMPPHFMGNLRFIKAVKRFRLFIHNDAENVFSNTKISIYYKVNDGNFELIRSVENIFEIETSINKKINSGEIKIEFEDMSTVVDELIQFHYSILEYNYLTKK